ncbi:MAG TPA: hypothetical protein DCE71_07935 [Parachlamydiales bacterium]|nr:hypothetical protein [Parachlamydiales bacterium]
MGLDMYLYEKMIDVKNYKPVADWRKANQIHGWFVDNVQSGNDDCKIYNVSGEQLRGLLSLCEKALETKDPTLLPPREGFFFGSYDIDESYWEDIEKTVEVLSKLDLSKNYIYEASW